MKLYNVSYVINGAEGSRLYAGKNATQAMKFATVRMVVDGASRVTIRYLGEVEVQDA